MELGPFHFIFPLTPLPSWEHPALLATWLTAMTVHDHHCTPAALSLHDHHCTPTAPSLLHHCTPAALLLLHHCTPTAMSHLLIHERLGLLFTDTFSPPSSAMLLHDLYFHVKTHLSVCPPSWPRLSSYLLSPRTHSSLPVGMHWDEVLLC